MITVFSKQVFEFKREDEKFFTKLDEFAQLPDWVTETPTYKAGLQAGLIIESTTKVTPAKIINSPKVEQPKEYQTKVGQPKEEKDNKTEQPKEDGKDKKSSTSNKK
jgi:hypothetical protein